MATNNSNNNTSYGLTINTTNVQASFATNGVMSNLNQPGFKASVSADLLNVTGFSTQYTVLFDAVEFDTYSQYNPATGLWLPTHTGIYIISYGVTLFGMDSSNTDGQILLEYNGNIYHDQLINAFNMSTASGAYATIINSVIVYLPSIAGAFKVVAAIEGSGPAENISINGAVGQFLTYFSAIKIA